MPGFQEHHGGYGERSGFCRQLHYDGKTHGIMVVSVPASYAANEEEQSLFAEMVDDLGFALYKIEIAGRLHQSRRDLKAAQALARIGSWRFDLTSRLVTASQEARRVYGLDGVEWPAERIRSIPPPQYRDLLDTKLKQLVEEGALYEIEFQIRRVSDNAIRHIHSVAEYDAKRKIVIGTLQDITDRKLAEKALQASEEHYRTTLKAIGDGVIVTDTEGRVTIMNPIAEGLTGWSFADAEGAPLDEVFHIINDLTGQRVSSPVDKALSAGRIVGLANHTMLLSQTGDKHQIADSAAPIHGDAGDIIGMVLNDIIHRKRVETELRDVLTELSVSHQSAPLSMLLVDRERRVQKVNGAAAESARRTGEEMIGLVGGEAMRMTIHAAAVTASIARSVTCCRRWKTRLQRASNTKTSRPAFLYTAAENTGK